MLHIWSLLAAVLAAYSPNRIRANLHIFIVVVVLAAHVRHGGVPAKHGFTELAATGLALVKCCNVRWFAVLAANLPISDIAIRLLTAMLATHVLPCCTSECCTPYAHIRRTQGRTKEAQVPMQHITNGGTLQPLCNYKEFVILRRYWPSNC